MDKSYKSHSKTIKSLENKAKSGSLLSMFQLYENYRTGKYVEEIDQEKARKFESMISEFLPKERLIVNLVSLYNFRRLKDFEINLHDKLTVIIGDNGSGKTSIVEALAKSFSWFNKSLERGTQGRPLTASDVNVSAYDFAEVTAHFSLGTNTKFYNTLVKLKDGATLEKSSEVYDLRLLGTIYKCFADLDNLNYPLLAYYSVERSDFSLQQSYSEKAAEDSSISRYSAIDDASGKGKLEDFSLLYIELANLAEGESNSEARKLRDKIDTLQSALEKAFGGEELPKNNKAVIELDAMKLELEKLKSNNTSKYREQLDLVNAVIESVVPEVTDLKVDRSSGKVRLMVKNFGNTINITQLSQGQKTLVALVGDIARRLVTLNPNSSNPLDSHGIVIIDEIELHLHPRWQQEVVPSLQKAFRNLQLIVTTHSPQVLNHIKNESAFVYRLVSESDGISTESYGDTYGHNTDLIYEQNMGVSSRPQEVQKKIDYVYSLIQSKKLSEAKEAIDSLHKLIGDDSALIKASTLLKRMEVIGK